MGTQGGYGCRLTKQGSKCGPLLSMHSYGMAADLTFNKYTDAQNDQCFHAPLLELFPYMVKRGIFWGMAFNFEDSHHWEISEQTARSWLVRRINSWLVESINGTNRRMVDRNLAARRCRLCHKYFCLFVCLFFTKKSKTSV